MVEQGELLPVIQDDREAAAAFGRYIGRLTARDVENMLRGDWDATGDVQSFAAHRLRHSTDFEREEEEAYEIGKRDGYSEAVQDLDLATGGDGEYKGSPFGTVDVPAMKARIIERCTDADFERGLEAARVREWHGGWSYDIGPQTIPNGLVEMAFDAALGYCNVKICERRITKSMASHDVPLPVDQYEYGYFDEYGNQLETHGRRPYAWRRVAVPPPPSAGAIRDPDKEAETWIVNFCPDHVRDYIARNTAIRNLIPPVKP